jgi:hypothetical protein
MKITPAARFTTLAAASLLALSSAAFAQDNGTDANANTDHDNKCAAGATAENSADCTTEQNQQQ